MENAENSIFKRLDFRTFWGIMPRSSGRRAIFCTRALVLKYRQMRHWIITLFTALLPCMIQYTCFKYMRVWVLPACNYSRASCCLQNPFWWGIMTGFFISSGRLELWVLGPTLTSPVSSPRNGNRLLSLFISAHRSILTAGLTAVHLLQPIFFFNSVTYVIEPKIFY